MTKKRVKKGHRYELALIPIADSPQPEPGTAFEAFINHLSKPQLDEPIRLGLAWTDLPLESIVLFGLWPIFERLAEHLETPLTEVAVLTDSVAPRLHRLIEVGLLRLYPSSEAAADAFRDSVLQPIFTNLASLSPKDARALQELAMEPSCAFFVRCMNAGKELGERVRQQILSLRQSNRHAQDVKLLSDERIASPLAKYLDISHGPAHESAPWMSSEDVFWDDARAYLRTELGNLQRLRHLQGALGRLPVRLTSLVEQGIYQVLDLKTFNYTVAVEWLGAQLLLAAGNLSDAEYVWEHQRSTLQEAAYATSDQVLLNRLQERLRARGWCPILSDEPLVMDEARHLLTFYRQRRDDSAYRYWHAVVRLDVDQYIKDHGAAEIVCDPSILAEAVVRRDLSVRRDQLAAKIDWASLGVDEVQIMIEMERLPLTMIARFASQLNPGVLAACLPMLRARASEDAAVYTVLLRYGHIQLETRELLDQHELLTQAGLLHWTQRALDTRDLAYEDWLRVLKLLARRCKPSQVRALLRDPVRRSFVRFLFEEAILHSDILPHETPLIRKLLGKVLWRRIVFSAELACRNRVFRQVMQGMAIQEEGDTRCAPWKEMWSGIAPTFLQVDFARLCDVPREDVPRLLRIYSERRMFFWYYEGQPNLKRRWRRYTRRRQIFFQTLETYRVQKRTSSPSEESF